ncbi:hypothetical protein D3C75_943180 [compost metagenome]
MDRLAGQQVGDGQIESIEDLGEWIRLVQPALHITPDRILLLFAEINAINLFGHDAAGIGIAQFGRRRGAGLVIVGCWWLPRCRFCYGGLLLGDHGGLLGGGVTDNVIGGQGELHRLAVDHIEDDGACGDEVVTA